MRSYSCYQLLGIILATMGTLVAADIEEINHKKQNISFLNFSEKVEELQQDLTQFKGKRVSIDLSENNIEDFCAEDLANKLQQALKEGVFIEEINLSNNRIHGEGLKSLSSLLMDNNLKWLVVPTNYLDLEDMQQLMLHLKPFAKECFYTEEESESSEEILGKWMSKIIWLPKTYNLDRTPIPHSSKEAHKLYYSIK